MYVFEGKQGRKEGVCIRVGRGNKEVKCVGVEGDERVQV